MSTQTATAKITWNELYTTDVERAAAFYAGLFDGKTTNMGPYTMLHVGERDQVGFVENDREGVPSHWFPYVRVDDADTAVARARELGAEVYFGPENAGEMLRFAVLGDPQRATFGVVQPLGEQPAEPGERMIAWNELLLDDRDRAFSFYGDLFGWTTEPFGSDEYHVFKAGDEMVGGVTKAQEGGPRGWLVFFATDDVDARTQRARELGAEVTHGPTSMENVGRFAVLADPTGAAFGLHAGA